MFGRSSHEHLDRLDQVQQQALGGLEQSDSEEDDDDDDEDDADLGSMGPPTGGAAGPGPRSSFLQAAERTRDNRAARKARGESKTFLIQELRTKLAAQVSSLDEATRKTLEQRQHIDDLTTAMAQLKNETASRSNAGPSTATVDAANANPVAVARLQNAERTISALNTEREQLQDRIQDLTRALLHSSREPPENVLTSVMGESRAQQQLVNDLQGQLDESVPSATLNAAITLMNEELARSKVHAEATLAAALDESLELQQRAAALNQEIDDLNAERGRAGLGIEERRLLDDRYDELLRLASERIAQEAASREAVAAARDRAHELQEAWRLRSGAMENALVETTNVASELQQELAQAKSQLQATQARIAATEGMVATLNEQLATTRQQTDQALRAGHQAWVETHQRAQHAEGVATSLNEQLAATRLQTDQALQAGDKAWREAHLRATEAEQQVQELRAFIAQGEQQLLAMAARQQEGEERAVQDVAAAIEVAREQYNQKMELAAKWTSTMTTIRLNAEAATRAVASSARQRVSSAITARDQSRQQVLNLSGELAEMHAQLNASEAKMQEMATRVEKTEARLRAMQDFAETMPLPEEEYPPLPSSSRTLNNQRFHAHPRLRNPTPEDNRLPNPDLSQEAPSEGERPTQRRRLELPTVPVVDSMTGEEVPDGELDEDVVPS